MNRSTTNILLASALSGLFYIAGCGESKQSPPIDLTTIPANELHLKSFKDEDPLITTKGIRTAADCARTARLEFNLRRSMIGTCFHKNDPVWEVNAGAGGSHSSGYYRTRVLVDVPTKEGQ